MDSWGRDRGRVARTRERTRSGYESALWLVSFCSWTRKREPRSCARTVAERVVCARWLCTAGKERERERERERETAGRELRKGGETEWCMFASWLNEDGWSAAEVSLVSDRITRWMLSHWDSWKVLSSGSGAAPPRRVGRKIFEWVAVKLIFKY